MTLNNPIEDTGVDKTQLSQSEKETFQENSALSFRSKPYSLDNIPSIKHGVVGKGAGSYKGDRTFFQVGPHVYGGEVQDIQIVENKAVSSFLGARTNSDFLIDDGTGDANIVVTMMFSGADHIYSSLVPLIALFRICPITSIKNEMISAALLNKFTEGDVSTGEQLLHDKFDDLIDESSKFYKISRLDAKFSEEAGYSQAIFIDENRFNEVLLEKPYLPMFYTWPTFTVFAADKIKELDVKSWEDYNTKDKQRINKVAKDTAKKNLPQEDYDYVPVAFTHIEIQTHTELSDTITVQLIFKRIDADSYTTGGLLYRTLNDTPTYDARNAYWLRRALDLYIDRFTPSSWIFGATKDTNDPVTLKFAGEDIILNLFKAKHNLEDLSLNSNESIISQLSISYSNKFSFFRLSGSSYPTCHYMGSSSGTMSMAVKTNSPEKFESIHSYKSASDFFLRTQDRVDRFNGWEINSYLVRLFNNNENQIPREGGAQNFTSAWYPMQVVSSTNSDSPKLKDISLVFKETNPDFFSDYGFTIYKKGYNLERLRKFFKEMFDNAVSFREDGTDTYAHTLIFGKGNATNSIFSVINPDTIAAAFYETTRYNNSGYLKIESGDTDSLANQLNKAFELNTLANGELSATNGWSAGVEDLLLAPAAIFSSLEISDTNPNLVNKVAERFFENPDDELLRLLEGFYQESYRRDLYEYIYSHKEIKFTEDFKEALFAAIVKRRRPRISDRQYNVGGVVSAFSSLTIAVEAKGNLLLDEENSNALSQSRKDETKVYLDLSGVQSKTQTATSYPDFFKLTYDELFNINQTTFRDYALEKGRTEGTPFSSNSLVNPRTISSYFHWEKFLPTYQDYGIINSDPKEYENGFNQNSIRTAQDRPITDGRSFVPPSVFYYHEKKLPKTITDQIDKQSSEYFQKLKTLRLNLPFDIEKIITDQKGRSDGKRVNQPGLEEDLLGKNNRTLATIIEDMVGETYNKVGPNAFKEASGDIIRFMANDYIDSNGLESYEDISNNNEYRSSLKQELTAVIRGERESNTDRDWSKVSVPFLMASHINSPVTKWRNLTSLSGERMIGSILRKSIQDIDIDTFITETLTQASTGLDDNITITNSNEDENKTSMLKITQKISDNTESMMRAFPVMRLYIIEHVGPRILVQDNFYGYNAIESIDITIDKNDPALAVIRIVDPFHVLQGSTFANEFSNGKTLDGDFVLPASTNDPEGKDLLKRLKLRPGRSIQIRGGYASDPENLEVIFTGRIAEVEPGDIITIAAQGWKSELMGRQIEFELNSKDNSSVKDLVVSSIIKAQPAGFGDEYPGEARDMILDLANDLPAAQAIYNSDLVGSGTPGAPTSSPSRGTHGYSPLGFGIFRQLGRGIDLRLKNIWAPDKDRSRWNYFADISDTGWEGSTWIVPLQSCWEALQSSTNYMWNYICQVVPYESEATIFFGRPDQMYNFRTVDSMRYRAHNKLRASFRSEMNRHYSVLLDNFKTSTGYFHTSVPNQEIYSIRASNNDFLSGSGTARILNRGEISSYNNSNSVDFKTIGRWNTWTFNDHVQTHKLYSSYGYGLLSSFSKKDRDRNYFAKSLNSKDFTEDFNKIADLFGDNSKTATMLLSSFYGLNDSYIRRNLDPYVTVLSFVSPNLNIEKVEQDLQRLSSVKDEEFKEAKWKGSDISYESARVYYEMLSDPTAQYLSKDNTWNVTKTYQETTRTSIQTKYNFILKDDKVSLVFPSAPYLDLVSIYLKDYIQYENKKSAHIPEPKISIGKDKISISNSISSLSFSKGLRELLERAIANQSINELLSYAKTYFKKVMTEKSPEDESSRSFEQSLDIAFNNLDNPVSILNDKGFDFNSEDDIATGIVQHLPLFKSFVHFFAVSLNSLDERETEALNKIKESSSFDYDRALNMKVFRDYHYVTDKKDIIENNIAASTREMSNTVVVRYSAEMETSNNSIFPEWVPFFGKNNDDFDTTSISSETEWSTWPVQNEHIGMQFNSNVSLQEKKIIVHTDLNCQRRDQCAKVATNVLTKSMRPMYRNNLKIIGRPIKPWDIIYLKDDFVDMWGPVEVERVVHHYSAQTGWVTNIIPHAVCDANPGNKHVQTAIFNNKIDKIYNLVDSVLWVMTLATGVPVAGAGIAAASVAGRFGLSKALTLGSKKAIAGTVKENAKLGFGQGFKALGRDIGKGTTRAEVGESMKTLGRVIESQGPAFISSFFYKQGLLGTGLDTASRILIQNGGTAKNQLPVTFSPLIFKGIPLEAGLNGDSYTYYSLSSKLHWGLADFNIGVQDLTDSIFGEDPDSFDFQVIEAITQSKDI